MTLSFSTKWPSSMGDLAGQPNYFIDKIWNGLLRHDIVLDDEILGEIAAAYKEQFGGHWDWIDENDLSAKITTFREDPADRWKPGMDIHMVINNRTKNRFQFAPVVKCVSTQKIEISHGSNGYKFVFIKETHITRLLWSGYLDGDYEDTLIYDLAINDGFDSVEDFFAYFNKDFTGKIIHWTDLKY